MPSEKRARQRAGRAARMAELQRAQRRRRRNTRVIPVVAIVVLLAALGIFFTSRGGGHKAKKVTTATSAPAASAPSGCPKLGGPNPRVLHFSKAPPNCLQAGKSYTGTIVTNMGTVTVAFDTKKTPVTANNFIYLALFHYYDGTAIFRTDTSIGIIQGGSPHTEDNTDPGPGYTIPDEGTGFKYQAGDLVMARTSAPNSAGSQYFFCVTSACSELDGQGTYVTFAHTTAGLDVLQKILALNSGSGQLGGAPSKPVNIQSITITAT